MKPVRQLKKKKHEIYEHLEHYVKNTTYAHRLLWLEQANEFVRMVERRRKEGTLFVDKKKVKTVKIR